MNGAHIIPFDRIPSKRAARDAIVTLYEEYTGTKCIPPEKEYWTLAHLQRTTQWSEINQMVRRGLIQPEQFHGVDWSEDLIERNRVAHPRAHWYHGEWTSIISTHRFNPAIVYLDTQNLAGKTRTTQDLSRCTRAAKTTVVTMQRCPCRTMLFVNVMLNNPHDKDNFLEDDFIRTLSEALTPEDRDLWYDDPRCVVYTSTGRTKMGTFIFMRIG